MPAVLGDSDRTSHTSYNRRQASAYASQFYASQGFFRGPVRDIATYAVGPGMMPQSQVEDESTALLYEDYFRFWGENYADLAGKHTFNELQFLASIAIDVAGDFGLHMYSPTARSIPQLQVVEGHRIAGDQEGWRDGVRLDRFGRRVAYRVSEAPLGEINGAGGSSRLQESFRSIDAGEFIFLHDPDRADPTRGISSMAHALAHSRDVVDTLLYTKIQVKMDSAIGVVIKTHDGTADPGTSFIENGFAAKDTGGLPFETWQAGMIPRLKVGEDLLAPTASRPSPAFMGFLQFLLRDIAVGLGLPFEFVWDPAGVKGAGNRFILRKAQRRFDQRQALLKSKFLTRVWRWVIAKGIERGELPPAPWWWLVEWQGPAEITVDLGREAQANRDDLKYGNRTLAEDAAERGKHWKDHVRSQKSVEAKDLLERALELVEFAKGREQVLSLREAMFLISQDGPNPPPPAEIVTEEPGEGEEKDKPSESEEIESAVNAYGVAVRAGVVTPTIEDENFFRQRMGLPAISADARKAWVQENNVRRPITLVQMGEKGTPGARPSEGEGEEE